MPLETATRPFDLNVNNPLEGDPAKVGAAHIRLIKQMVKSIGLGNLTLAEAKALTAPYCTMFVYAEHLYQIQPNYIGNTALEDTGKVIFLNNGNRAYRIDNPSWLGSYKGTEVKKPGDFTAFRYPVVVHVKHTSSSFNDTAAAAACPGGIPVVGDVVAYQTLGTGVGITEAKIWRGAGMGWVRVDVESNGDLFVFGLLSTLRISAPTSVITQMRGHKLELVGTTNMEIRNPDGFGPDSLYYWFGKKAGLVDGNGEISYDLLTKTNAFKWGQVGATGAVEGGGGVNPGLPGNPTTGGAVVANLGMASVYRSNVVAYNGVTAEAIVQISLRTDGTFAILVEGDVTGFPLSGNWVTTPAANVGPLYEYKVEQQSGDNIASGQVLAFTPISVNKNIFQLATSSSSTAVFKETVFKLTIREIATPANVVAFNMTISARAQSFTGSEP